jgi:hypothetical protein
MDKNSPQWRLQVYKDRLKSQIDDNQIAFYKAEIQQLQAEVEAEAAVSKLISEMIPWELTTDDIETVREIQRTCKVFSVDRKWVWKYFDFFYHVKFLPK